MRGNINGLIELTRPILAQTMTYLIKMTEPCSGIFKGGRVIFKDHGEFIIKEVINDQNFTIYLIKETLPEEVQVTHIDVKMKDSFQKISQEVQKLEDSFQKMSQEVQKMKDSILDDSRLKTLNVRMSLLENLVAESLEKL
jgi:hypothetical protein